MKALITNDDGVSSVGIRTLAAAAIAAGLEVVVAAPHTERSGASAALTGLTVDPDAVSSGAGSAVRFRVDAQEIEISELPGVRVFSVEASPASIAFIGVRGAFGEVPDVVLSGINHGTNTGHAILHSGTVGAAYTAALHGVPALALSLGGRRPAEWETAAIVSRHAIEWLTTDGRGGWVLNVNIPDVIPSGLRGIKRASLAQFGGVDARVEAGEGYYTVTISETAAAADVGSDAALLREGWATATVLEAPYEKESVDLSVLEAVFSE